MKTQSQQSDQQFMLGLRQWMEKQKQFQEKISISLQKCEEAREAATSTISKIDKFKADMGNVMSSLAEKFAGSNNIASFEIFNNPEEVQSNCTIDQAVSLLQNSKVIIFLTGAGISVASGMPTFRGSGGIWTQNDENFDPKDICTYKFFQERQQLYWNWNNEFLTQVRNCKPNINHIQIAKLHDYFNKNINQQNVKMHLITQNIDGYHVRAKEELQRQKNEELGEYKNPQYKAYGLCNDIYEIHGNMNYLRCQNGCVPALFNSPEQISKEKFLFPVCPKCQNPARPHVLYFDECYDEQNYRRDTVTDLIENCDLLFVIGTMLETGFSSNIVRKLCQKNVQIIEINPLPIIDNKNNHIMKGKAEDILPNIIDKFFEQINYKPQINKDITNVKQPLKENKKTNQDAKQINKKNSNTNQNWQSKGNQSTPKQQSSYIQKK